MWCDFEWDAARLPDPRRLMAALHREGFHNCLWINPYVSCQSALYQEGVAARPLPAPARRQRLRRSRVEPAHRAGHGALRHRRLHQPRGRPLVPGPARPPARRSAPIPSSRTSPRRSPRTPVFANGLTGAEMHNPYPLLFQQRVLRGHAGRPRPRAPWPGRAAPRPGVQRYPGHWAGDSGVHVPRSGQHAARRPRRVDERARLLEPRHRRASGAIPRRELYVRWAQLGFLSALSRYHGATPRDPWRFGDEALAIFREYARLRSRLVPYLVSYGWQASDDGRAR